MKLITVLCLMALPMLVSAAAIKVKQVDNRRMKVVASKSKYAKVGSEWVVTVKKGNQCSLPVVEVAKKMVILDGADCPHFNKIRSGQWMKENLLVKSSKKTFAVNTSSSKKSGSSFGTGDLKGFSVFAYFSMADELKANIKSDGQSSSVTGATENQLGVGAEYQYDLDFMLSDMRTALRAGGSYELERSISKFKSNGNTVLSGASFSLLSFHLNGVVKISDDTTGFIGGNYTMPQAGGKLIKGGTDNFEADPGFGWQVGGSFQVEKDIAVDGMYRSVIITNDGDSANLDGLLIRGRYVF